MENNHQIDEAFSSMMMMIELWIKIIIIREKKNKTFTINERLNVIVIIIRLIITIELSLHRTFDNNNNKSNLLPWILESRSFWRKKKIHLFSCIPSLPRSTQFLFIFENYLVLASFLLGSFFDRKRSLDCGHFSLILLPSYRLRWNRFWLIDIFSLIESVWYLQTVTSSS